MENILQRIKRLCKITDFYKCLFVTWDSQKNLIVPVGRLSQVISYGWIVVHLIQLVCEVVSVATRASTQPQILGGMTFTYGYFIGFLWRLDLKRDYVQGQVWNLLAARKGIFFTNLNGYLYPTGNVKL